MLTQNDAFLGCLQLLEILEISWNFKSLLEIPEIYCNFIDASGKFNCRLRSSHWTKSGYGFKPEKLSFDHFCALHVFVSHVVIIRRLDQCKNPAGTLLNVSWKSCGNLLGCICRHPAFGLLEHWSSFVLSWRCWRLIALKLELNPVAQNGDHSWLSDSWFSVSDCSNN